MKPATVKISSKGKIMVPKEVRDSLKWNTETELTLVVTEQGVMLRATMQTEKQPVKSLRVFLQYNGEAVSTERLCQPAQ